MSKVVREHGDPEINNLYLWDSYGFMIHLIESMCW